MKFSRLRCLALGLPILLIGVYALAVSPAGDYHLLKKIPFGAAPGGSEYSIRRLTTSTSPHRILVRHRPPPRNSPIRSQSLPRERFTF